MVWLVERLADNGSTIAVLLILLVVVGMILCSMIKGKAFSCDGCSGDCAGCGGACPSASLELTAEQRAELEAFRQRSREWSRDQSMKQGQEQSEARQ